METLSSDVKESYTFREELESFIEEVKEHFKPFYQNVGPVHGFAHVEEVTRLALEMYLHSWTRRGNYVEFKFNVYDMIIAGIAHDIFSTTDRINHHTSAAEYIRNDTGAIYDKCSNKEVIALAVEQHRGSYTGVIEDDSLSMFISDADRGRPDFIKVLKRGYQCYLDEGAIFEREDKLSSILIKNDSILLRTYADLLKEMHLDPAIYKTVVHLYDKYSKNGYMRYSKNYRSFFRNDLDRMHNVIDAISLDEIIRILV